MKRIHNTEMWTDGVETYRKNENGDFVVHGEDSTRIVEINEPIMLFPVDNSDKE